MRTEFDIGDIITLEITGEVVSYSADDKGDCYTVAINDGKGRDDWLYFSSEALKMSKPRLIARRAEE